LRKEGEQGTRPPVQPQLFDPLNLTEEASLNSLELASLPGADPACIGRHAFEVLSLHALQRLAAEAGDARTDAPDESMVVGWLLEHPSRRAATHAFARRLAHLIATLTVEPGPGTSAQGWRRAFLNHWLAMERVWLAGGVVAGLGSDLLEAARSEAARLGSQAQIDSAPHAGELALIGAARMWPPSGTSRNIAAASLASGGRAVGRCAAVLDCGHTAVKRAVALADEHGLRRLVLLPACATAALGTDPSPEALASFVAECVVSTLEAARAHGQPDSLVRVSLASYVRGGQPISPRGLYGRLPVQRLVGHVKARTGEPFDVRLGHDGTLAAAGLPELGPGDGVIVVGTYLGSGFPPPPDRLLPLAPDFAIARAGANA
jgi:hypothetical protein